MPYSQNLIDDFNDNSLDEIWEVSGTTSETGGKINLPATSAYPTFATNQQYIYVYYITDGLFAVKLSRSGTATAETEFYFGFKDTDGSTVELVASPSTTSLSFAGTGAASVSDQVITDTSGLSGWTNGNWLGVGRLGEDNVIRAYKSSDGVTWTEMARCTVTGLNTDVEGGLTSSAGVWSGSTTWAAQFDDASFFYYDLPPAKVRVGGAWVPATPKVRLGGAWVDATARVRSGGAWTPTP